MLLLDRRVTLLTRSTRPLGQVPIQPATPAQRTPGQRTQQRRQHPGRRGDRSGQPQTGPRPRSRTGQAPAPARRSAVAAGIGATGPPRLPRRPAGTAPRVPALRQPTPPAACPTGTPATPQQTATAPRPAPGTGAASRATETAAGTACANPAPGTETPATTPATATDTATGTAGDATTPTAEPATGTSTTNCTPTASGTGSPTSKPRTTTRRASTLRTGRAGTTTTTAHIAPGISDTLPRGCARPPLLPARPARRSARSRTHTRPRTGPGTATATARGASDGSRPGPPPLRTTSHSGTRSGSPTLARLTHHYTRSSHQPAAGQGERTADHPQRRNPRQRRTRTHRRQRSRRQTTRGVPIELHRRIRRGIRHRIGGRRRRITHIRLRAAPLCGNHRRGRSRPGLNIFEFTDAHGKPPIPQRETANTGAPPGHATAKSEQGEKSCTPRPARAVPEAHLVYPDPVPHAVPGRRPWRGGG